MIMTKVNIIDRFDTSLGKAIIVDANQHFRVNDSVIVDGVQCTIKMVVSPTRPTQAKNNTVTLIIS